MNYQPAISVKEVFLNLVKDYASKFAEATFETKDVTRFLGNASFRCPKLLPNINYMIHSHCYINGAPFTKKALPCGAIEEVEEILKLLKEEYYNDFNKDFYLINLLGHGSIMMSKNPEQLININMVGRKLPENMYLKK